MFISTPEMLYKVHELNACALDMNC